MNNFRIYITLIITTLLSVVGNVSYAQYGDTPDDQKAKFLYEIPKYLVWENDADIMVINIGIVNSDPDFLKTLRREAKKPYPGALTKVVVKDFVSVEDAAADKSLHVLYAPYGVDFKKALTEFHGRPVALVSDNFTDTKQIFLNFVDERTGLVSFRFSSANLRKVGISVHENMTKQLHGEDISKEDIIQRQSQQLTMTQKELEAKEKELNEKQELLDLREMEIFQKQQQIEVQNRNLAIQNRAIPVQQQKLESQKREMQKLQALQAKTNKELAEAETNLEAKNAEISNVALELDKQRHEVAEQQKIAEEQKKHIEEVNIEISTKEAELKKLGIKNDLLNNILTVALVALGIFLILIIFIVKLYIGKRKDNQKLAEQNTRIEQQNVELAQQKDILAEQKDTLAKQKDNIIESIRYAQKIQQAVMPPMERFSQFLPEHFIMLRPRDIVSGDFYWGTHVGDKFVYTAADCTGHGVPGAFMSLLGIAFLNDITARMTSENITAGEILTQLRADIITYLRQSGKEDEQKDGMDMALCVYDKANNKIQYAGAHNPLIIIRNNELIQYDADEMPIGYYENQTEYFTNNEIDILPGDMTYMFSDGYPDQFGMDKGRKKKYMIKRFRDFLMKIHHEDLPVQARLLEDNLDAWRGELKQLDDILVMGVRF